MTDFRVLSSPLFVNPYVHIGYMSNKKQHILSVNPTKYAVATLRFCSQRYVYSGTFYCSFTGAVNFIKSKQWRSTVVEEEKIQ